MVAGRVWPSCHILGVIVTTENMAILFTDVVGSTELSQRLSADEADEVRRAHFSTLRRAIAETGGTEVKTLGDGLMVVFASASPALACAVAMQQAVAQDNFRRHLPVGLRVGLSGGEVNEEQHDYFGDPVVEAARLCAICESGQVLASDVVRLTAGRRSRHRYRSLGAITLKGLPDPVETVEVLWEPPVATVTTLAVIDDHPVYRDGLAAAVAASGRFELLGAFDSVESYLDQEAGAEVVLLDYHLPGLHGPAAVARVTAGGAAVLMVSGDIGRDAVLATLASGARGYVAKHAEVSEIVDAITTICASPSGTYVSPQLAAYLLDAYRRTGPNQLQLSPREQEVLALVAQGERDQDIAEALFISVGTVRSHLDHIRTKTGERRRAGLTRYAVDQGFVAGPGSDAS
jgi:DNA-binding NarL/FixJ family response regulator/class 3 adenylate cyclase